jgi:adenylate cyclase
MAFCGAPLRHDQPAYAACVAAVRSQRGLALLNQAWAAQKLPPLKLRIGVHSDAVLVGNIGSVERISYTVMGDGANVAARLEGINKEMGTWTCVSHNVFREAGERLWLRPIDMVTVKGRKGELLIYELLAIRDGDAAVAATPEEIDLCELTTAAYAEYANGNWENALSSYAKILVKYPHDQVAQRMLEKSRERIAKAAA